MLNASRVKIGAGLAFVALSAPAFAADAPLVEGTRSLPDRHVQVTLGDGWDQVHGAMEGTPAIGSFRDRGLCSLDLAVHGRRSAKAPVVRRGVLHVAGDSFRIAARGRGWYRSEEREAYSAVSFTAVSVLPGRVTVTATVSATYQARPGCLERLRAEGPGIVGRIVRSASIGRGKAKPGTKSGQKVTA